jgi:hypothetical protein
MADEYDEDTPRDNERLSQPIPVPQNLFDQQLQDRVQRLEARVGSLTASRKTSRWIVGLGLPVLLSAIFGLILYSADKIAANSERVGGTAAEMKALSRQIESLEREIGELRAVLLRLSGINSKPITIVRYHEAQHVPSMQHCDRLDPVLVFTRAGYADAPAAFVMRPDLLDQPGVRRLLRRLPSLLPGEVQRDAACPAGL